MKKFRRSPIATACYVIAALLAAYFLSVVVTTIVTITNYYAAYDMNPGVGEVIGYLLQNGLEPLAFAVMIFMAGYILETVRRQDPANFMTDEEVIEAKEAKRMAKEARKIAKGEAAKAAAEAAAEAEGTDPADETVRTEFAAVIAGEDGEELVVIGDSPDEETSDTVAAIEESDTEERSE